MSCTCTDILRPFTATEMVWGLFQKGWNTPANSWCDTAQKVGFLAVFALGTLGALLMDTLIILPISWVTRAVNWCSSQSQESALEKFCNLPFNEDPAQWEGDGVIVENAFRSYRAFLDGDALEHMQCGSDSARAQNIFAKLLIVHALKGALGGCPPTNSYFWPTEKTILEMITKGCLSLTRDQQAAIFLSVLNDSFANPLTWDQRMTKELILNLANKVPKEWYFISLYSAGMTRLTPLFQEGASL